VLTPSAMLTAIAEDAAARRLRLPARIAGGRSFLSDAPITEV
jgi:hypothetical protein